MDNLSGSKKLSEIELAKSLAGLKGHADSSQDFDALKANLVPKEHLPRVNQILHGLAHEDDFAIFCKIMGTCESISRIDQTPIVESDEKAADFLASFRPGVTIPGACPAPSFAYNCFVEVKATSKQVFSISQRDLRVRRQFATRFGLPLVVAVRFTMFQEHAPWLLIDSKALELRGRKVDCAALIGSLGPVLFNDYALLTLPGLRLIRYYDSSPGLSGIQHVDRGTQTKTVLHAPDSSPIVIPDNVAMLVNVFFESFDQKVIEVQKDGKLSAVVSDIGLQSRFLSDIVYGSNCLARTRSGERVYDARRTIARLDSSAKPTLITRAMIEYAVQFLNKQHQMLFGAGIGEPAQQDEVLKSLRQ